jgi:trimeric autotransporter adhesin
MTAMRPLFAALLLASSPHVAAEPFVFRGQLDDGAVPAEGRYALRLTLYGAERGAVPLAEPVELLDVALSAGRFAAGVDFGALPPYAQGWLEVAAKADGDIDYTTLAGRTPVDLKAATACPAAWALGGNALTNASVDFLGTTDAQPLEFRVGNVQIGRFETRLLPAFGVSLSNVVSGGPGNVVAAGVTGTMMLAAAFPPEFVPPPGVGDLRNHVSDHFGLVLGGFGNVAGDFAGTLDDASSASVIGSEMSRASGRGSVVLGGNLATASGDNAFANGFFNAATGAGSVVLGGSASTALGLDSVAIGGSDLCAGANSSWAGGNRAKVRPPAGSGSDLPGAGCDNVPNAPGASGDAGTFVWADAGSGDDDFVSTGANQFAIRARGGVRLSDETSQYFGAATRQVLNLYSTSYGIGVQDSTLYQRSNSQFAWFRDGAHGDGALDPGAGGALLMTLGTNAGTPVGTARAQQFVNVSDRHAKTAFAPIDTLEVLARVLQLPLSEWSYRTAPSERHIGPMAQDFRAAFGLGGDDKTIATIDADGVALAAIQGLNTRLEAENAALRAQDQALRDALDTLRAELEALRLRLDRSRP